MPTTRSRWRDKFRPMSGPRHERCPEAPDERERFIRERVQLDGMFREQGIQYLIEGNAFGFLLSEPEGNTNHLPLVAENVQLLRSLRLYEAALVAAFSSTRTNNLAHPVWCLERLIRWMNPDRLAALRPLPPGDEFRVYRGVAGEGEDRRVNGLSWTGSLECAAWFAMRSEWLADPAVYVATVTRDEVWWHESERDEDEFIVRPTDVQRLAMSRDELLELADRRNARNAAEFEEIRSRQRVLASPPEPH